VTLRQSILTVRVFFFQRPLAETRDAMERVKQLIDDHNDLAGFLGFVLLGLLIYVGLSALENRHYMTVRFSSSWALSASCASASG